MIWIQNQLVGAATEQNITLECQSEAFPKSLNYWAKEKVAIIQGKCKNEFAACQMVKVSVLSCSIWIISF